MPFKMSGIEELCQHILVKNGNRAGKLSQLPVIVLHQLFGKNQIPHPHRRGKGFGKGIEVENPVTSRHSKEGLQRLTRSEELAAEIILHQIPVRLRPGEVFKAFPCGGGHSGGVAPKGSHMEHRGRGF